MVTVITGPVTAYLRDVAGDSSTQILFWSAEECLLLDESGHPAASTSRVSSWVQGRDGTSVALLGAGSAEALSAASNVVDAHAGTLLVESSLRLAVLRRRVAEQQQTLAAARLDVDGLRDVAPGAVVDRLEETLRLALRQGAGPTPSEQLS
jgi:hypothetical protein